MGEIPENVGAGLVKFKIFWVKIGTFWVKIGTFWVKEPKPSQNTTKRAWVKFQKMWVQGG